MDPGTGTTVVPASKPLLIGSQNFVPLTTLPRFTVQLVPAASPTISDLASLEHTLQLTMTDLGLRTLNTDVRYSAIRFGNEHETYWFPTDAIIEVETARQHWRNLHHFTKYQQFNVSTQESVKPQ